MYSATVGSHILNLRNAYPLGINQIDLSVEDDTLPTPQMNVVKSVIDTLISKIASTKIRPYFSPVQVDFKTLKVLKQLQIYFDDLYERYDINKKITESFRDACIFDTGVLFVDPVNYTVEKINPWQVSILDAEYHYNGITKALLYFYDFPVSLLKRYGVTRPENQARYVTLEIYFDTESKELVMYVNNKEARSVKYEGPVPFVFMHYTTPVKGSKTVSVVDDLYNIQLSIDLINAKIKEAVEMTAANTILVPDGSNLNVEMLNNRTGNILRYKPVPGSGNPVEVVAPAFINPEYQAALDSYIKKAYEMIGMSTLSAQSMNPLGANASGAALQSMENIESTRFETQLNQVIRSYVDLSKLLIAVYPDEADILPRQINRSGFRWSDVKKQAQLINIQYSAQTILSKDPSTKLQQIMQLSQVGGINAAKVFRYLEMPDLTEVFTLATASQDAADKVIQMAVEENIFDIPKFVSYELLEESITSMQNQLLGAYTPKNREILESLNRLQALDDMLQEIMIREGFTPIQPTGPVQVSESGIGAAGAVEAPSSVDVTNNLENPPETANDKDQTGEV
jgi:hypothetical protein